MENTFFFELLQTLSSREIKQFQDFVASPWFNGRAQLSPLLRYFAESRKNEAAPDAKAAFAAAFPGEAFDDQKGRLSLSQLYKLAEQFLAQLEMDAEPAFPKLPLARAFRKRGLAKHFQRTIEALRKEQAQRAERPAGFYEDEYQVEWERYRFLSSGKRTESFNLQEVSDAMDAAFIARKLRHACFARSHQSVFSTEYRLGLLDAVLEEVKQRPALLALPAINLYYQYYLVLTRSNAAVAGSSEGAGQQETPFEQFKQLLFEQGGHLPSEERRNLFLLAINFGIRQINAGQPQYDRPVLDLYKMALENDLLLENGQLSRFAFNNIVAIGARIGETEWVENFIRQYKNTLDRSHRNISTSLGFARIEYARKNYREALLHLQRSDFKDLINNLIAKTLQLKVYYETGEFEALESHLRNMKTYIRRQRSIGYHKENYLNIIRFTQALVEMNPFDKSERSALKASIGQTEKLTEREWLLEMSEK